MIRLQRRLEVPRWADAAVPFASLLAALGAGSVLLVLTGNDPIDTYVRIIERGFTSQGALTGTVRSATPLLFTALAATAAFRMGVFNIVGEGQLFMGAIAASGVAFWWGEPLGPTVVVVMIAAGLLAGAFWGAIPGVLRARFNTSEIITSLMLNYVARNIATYLIFDAFSSWRTLEGPGRVFPTGRSIPTDAEWQYSHIGPIDFPFGFWLGVVACAFVWVLYRRTRSGFEVDIIGDSPSAASYAGMRTRRKIVSVMGLSGALAGLAGASNVGDFTHALDPKGLQQAGYGYAGIVIAALARLNPLAVVPVALLMGGLSNAGLALQGPDFPAGLVGTLQGLILFFVLGGEVLVRYSVRFSSRTQAVSA